MITSGSGDGNGTVGFTISANTSGAWRTATLTVAGQSFSVTQYTPLRFVAVTPCRVVDTRNANGPLAGPILAGGNSRDFPLPTSACGIPPSAEAYALNVEVIPNGPLSYLTVWPSGQPQPVVSTLNSPDGRNKSNAAVVPSGSGGSVGVYATDDTHLILDITGYFVPPAVNPFALAFYPLTPCRVADTRSGQGALGGPSLVGGQSRTFPVLSSNCGIPAAAQAYSLNFTAIPQGPLGYLTAYPAGQSLPLATTLNAPTGTVTANAAITAAGTSSAVNVFATNNTDLVIDINGYFAPAAPGGLSLNNLAPCRLLDTRGSQPFSGQLTVGVSGAPGCLAPSGAGAYVLNATVIPGGFYSYLSLWPYGQAQPSVSTLNAYDGALTSNMALVPASGGYINAFNGDSAYLLLDVSGYFAP